MERTDASSATKADDFNMTPKLKCYYNQKAKINTYEVLAIVKTSLTYTTFCTFKSFLRILQRISKKHTSHLLSEGGQSPVTVN